MRVRGLVLLQEVVNAPLQEQVIGVGEHHTSYDDQGRIIAGAPPGAATSLRRISLDW